MKKTFFDTLLDKSQDSVNKDLNNLYFFDYIYRPIAKRINEISQENPQISNEEIEMLLYRELEDYLEAQRNIGVKGHVFRKLIQDKLKSNKIEFKKAYNIAVADVDEKFENRVINNEERLEYGDYEKTKISLMKYYIVAFRKYKENLVIKNSHRWYFIKYLIFE